MSEQWLHGWSRDYATAFVGGTARCACCGKLLGVACTVHSAEPPGPEPDWPFEESTCPLCAMIREYETKPRPEPPLAERLRRFKEAKRKLEGRTTRADAFLQAILAAPDDDAPRLIYADWLDEHGDADRAEFIRVQCRIAYGCLPDCTYGCPRADCPRCALRARESELLTWENAHEWAGWPQEVHQQLTVARYHRGFVGNVETTLAAWCGEECPQCEVGWVGRRPVHVERSECGICDGIGRVNALGIELVRAAPILSVDLSQSHSPQLIDGAWFWFFTDAVDSPASLPRFLAAYFTEESFDDGKSAMLALSAGALKWAREKAGLEKSSPRKETPNVREHA